VSLQPRSHKFLALSLALCLSACGEDPVEGPLELGPLALSLDAPVNVAPEVRVVASFQASPDLAERWDFYDAEASYMESEGGGALLITQSSDSAAFGIPIEMEAGAVNQVVVHLENVGNTNLTVVLEREDELQLRTRTIQRPTTRVSTPAIIDLSKALTTRESLREGSDKVKVFCWNQNKAVKLYGVDLLWVPPELSLPMPGATPSVGEPLELGGEYRSALCLKGGVKAKGSAKVSSGTQLRFAFGTPEHASISGGRGELVVTARAEGREPLQEVYSIESRGGRADDWTEERMDLSPLAGAEVRFEFEHLSPGSDEGIVALSTPRLMRPSSDPRHVILITSDTHRGDHLGVAGKGIDIRTPFLDSLAEDGVFFEDCFSTSNITVPSHASIMTGLSPKEVGIIDNITALSGGAETLAEAFRDEGYYTAAVLSTMHLGHDNSGLGQGFERMFTSTQDKQVGQVSIESVREIFRSEGDQPVFLWLHLFDAHAPYLPPDEYRNEYYPRDRNPYTQGSGITDGNRAVWDKRLRDLEFILCQYKSEVTYLDALLAEVFDTPAFEDSIIAFTADHGESLGGHGIFFRHRGLHTSTIDIPLIMRWPGCPKGTRVKGPVQHSDLGRTLLDLAGLGAAEFAGASLLERLDANAKSAPRFMIGSHGHHAAVEQDGWLCVLTIQATIDFPRSETHQIELYHLNGDSACEVDLVDEEFERAKAMRRGLIDWLAAGKRPGLALVRDQRSVELLEAIAALGYTTDGGGGGGAYYEEDPENEWCERFR
jgi:arylsulfatase A-like enzyme